ncbi:MAG: ABC transporter ATP-binding protein [Erysipelotrichaceae bacterium]|nr:ABC transporter ATP-binding protein [Erysipelotrichaceae bacterium]
MTAVIEFKDFSFRYQSQQEPTLHDINLTIHQGEKVLILGPSGSGKSTLGCCINGLIPFSYNGEIKGSCKVVGIETKNANIFTISQHVGTVQQDTDAQFVGLSVGEDIAFSLENNATPRDIMLEKVDAAAKTVDMSDFLWNVPFNLSGGQKQKVALGGILHDEEEILLFDEPLAALDPAMGMTAVDLIDKIHKNQNKTIIIIEHRLEDVLYRKVDRIILMNEGRIAMDTTPDELLRSNLLKESGIREPLYISALKNAGVVFGADEHLDSVDELDIEKYRPFVEKHFEKVNTNHMIEKGEELIRVKDVDFYYGSRQVLKNVSFTIHKGERISIIGKNGAGKTTIARLLCGIVRPKNGEVYIKGQNYLHLSIREIGRLIGYVMQNPNQMLVKDMIRDEIALALTLNEYDQAFIDERVELTLRMTGLYEMRNWPVSVLSYGQRKRVTIASILALQPDVIILDEPTAGQDYHHYTEIMKFIEDINKNYDVTILFITHDMHLAIEYTDRSIVFADGECIADDLVYKVLSNDDVISRANLKHTSLVHIANRLGIDPEEYIHHFIEIERGVL